MDPVLRQSYRFSRQGDVLRVDIAVEPGSGVPKHFHPHLEERWQVLDGEFVFWIEGSKHRARAGEQTMVVAPGVRHAFKNVGSGTGHLRAEVDPALDMEQALIEGAALARAKRFTPRGIPRGLSGLLAVADFLERYRESIVFTFPPLIVQRLVFTPLLRLRRLASK